MDIAWTCFKDLCLFFYSRVTFYADLFQKLFGCENILHTEIARVGFPSSLLLQLLDFFLLLLIVIQRINMFTFSMVILSFHSLSPPHCPRCPSISYFLHQHKADTLDPSIYIGLCSLSVMFQFSVSPPYHIGQQIKKVK